MGRSLNWYVIQKSLEHDKTKTCFGFEYEPEEEEYDEAIYEKVTGGDDYHKDIDHMPIKEMLSKWTLVKKMERKQKISNCVRDFMYNGAENMCPLCRLYTEGFYRSPLVVAKESVDHSYSNPLWLSKWCVQDLYMGNSNHDFVNRFDQQHMYRIVDKESLDNACMLFNYLGNACHRPIDKEAKAETERILEFCKKWVAEPDVIIVFQDEM